METKNKSTQSGSGKKWWLPVGAMLVALIGGLIFFTPLILRVGLEKWLLANGADQVRISGVRLNPLAGSLSIQGVEIVRDSKKVVLASETTLEVELTGLFRKKAILRRAALHGVEVDLEQRADGSWSYGFFTPPSSAEEKPPEPKQQSSSPWILGAEEILVSDSQVHLKTPDLELTLTMDSLRLSELSTATGAQPAKLVFSGSINEAPVSLDLDSLHFLPHPSLSGTVDTRGFQLAWLADFLKPYLRPFTGAATVNGAVRLSLGPDTDLDVAYDGLITLEQGDLGGDSWGVRGKKVSYSGKARFQMPPRGAMVVDVDGRLQGSEVEVAVPAAELQIRQQHLLVTGPVQIRIGEEVRVDSGAAISAGKTDLTLPILAIGDTALSWKGKVSYNSGTASRNQQVSFNGALLVKEPALALDTRNVALHTGGKEISYQGKGRYTSPLEGQADHTVALNGVLLGAGLRFTMPDQLDLTQQHLRLAGRTSVRFGGQSAVQVDGELDLEDGRQRILSLLTGAQNALNWKGTARWQQDDRQQAVLLDGTLQGAGLNVLLQEQPRQLSLKDLSLTTKAFDLRLEDQDLELHGSGDLRASQLLVSDPGAGYNILRSQKLTITGFKAPDKGPVTVSEVGLQALEIDGGPLWRLHLSLPSLELQRMASQDLEHFTIEALRSGPLTVTNTRDESDQGGIGRLEAGNIQADTGGNVRVDRLRVENIHLFPGEKNETLRLGSILVSQPGWSMDKGLFTKEIVLKDLFMDLQIDHQGALNLTRALRELTGSPDPAPSANPAEKKEAAREYSGPALQIASIRLEGKNRILFADHRAATDYTRKHPFTMELVPTRTLVKQINSMEPETPASYSLEAMIDKFSYLSIGGTARLFGPSLALEQKVHLKNYPLVNLSPYAADAIGVEFTRGQLELQAKIHIADNIIDADNNFFFKKVDVQTVDKEKAKALPFDLDYALAILRDSNGNIELKVPISGPLNKLDVGLSGLLITAMNKAVVTGASSYLIYALGPYAALAYLGAKVGNEILKTRLAPVEFAPGSDVLSEKQTDYLDRVAKILQDRPKLELQLCPKLARDDLPRDTMVEELSNDDKERLLGLAERRAIAVRHFLTGKHGIDPRRLLICSSAFDTGNGGKPRVDLQL